MRLSEKARAVWAKKAYDGDTRWLPLAVHMQDSAHTARWVWGRWLAEGTRLFLTQVLGATEELAERVFIFLAAVHDLGKATPAFQFKPGHNQQEVDDWLMGMLNQVGLQCPSFGAHAPSQLPHAAASQLILQKYMGLCEELAGIVGAHHGKALTRGGYEQAESHPNLGGLNDPAWCAVQRELFDYACELAEITPEQLFSCAPVAQMLCSGVLTMTDWLASNEDIFPLMELDQAWTGRAARQLEERGQKVLEDFFHPDRWTPNGYLGSAIYRERFATPGRNFVPRPLQTAVLEVIDKTRAPGLIILEAPMGEGKTEAALAAAEVLASRTGRSGVYFALPTQATANALFRRFRGWMSRLDPPDARHSLYLAHGKAALNADYAKLDHFSLGDDFAANIADDSGGANVVVHTWFTRKKGLLADFAIGTIDQVLLAALRQKHLAVRHAGLCNKVVVLDEVHSFSAYMNTYLESALSWLGAYGVPVVVLSATLPPAQREKLTKAYTGSKKTRSEAAAQDAYPLITCTDLDEEGKKFVWSTPVASAPRDLHVALERLDGEVMVEVLRERLAWGGCAGIIVNTVGRAQAIAQCLAQAFPGEVELLHSRFLARDRQAKEKALFERLGPGDATRPERLIVVGTQIFEQSCDLDFDIMLTDLCPMDLLIQRLGRLHRHPRARRPAPVATPHCLIMVTPPPGQPGELDPGGAAVYGSYLLMNTARLLAERDTLHLPADIPSMVRRAYEDYRPEDVAKEERDDYGVAWAAHQQKLENQKTAAKTYRLALAKSLRSFSRAMEDAPSEKEDPSGRRGEAQVREGQMSIEVLVIQRRNNGRLYLLPTPDGKEPFFIAADEIPTREQSLDLAAASLTLSGSICYNHGADNHFNETVVELEEAARALSAWQQSPWLKGQLFLVLDEQLTACLNGHCLRYDLQLGLLSEKITQGGTHGEKI